MRTPASDAPPAAPDLPSLSRDELVRYARHLVLPHVGEDGQRRLKGSRVLVVGAGGLGSPAALYLAAAGVGTLGIVDADRVDASNLQRQVLHGTSDLDRPKVESAGDRLRDLNPHIDVRTHEERLTSANALDVLADYDVVLDGSDNFPTRYLVNDAGVLSGTPVVYGAILRWEGQVSLFATPEGPCYRCLFREPPPDGLVPDCATAGVFGALPGVVGSMQALEALKWILGVGDSLAGRLLLFDALGASWREVRVRRNPACPVCGDEPTQRGLIDYELFCGVTPEDVVAGRATDAAGDVSAAARAASDRAHVSSEASPASHREPHVSAETPPARHPEPDVSAETPSAPHPDPDVSAETPSASHRQSHVSAEAPSASSPEPHVSAETPVAGRADAPFPALLDPLELAERLAGDEPPLVVDVREPWEWRVGNLADRGAVNVPLDQVSDRLGELPVDRPLVAVCRTGARSGRAARALRDAGYTVSNLRGGLVSWAKHVDPDLIVP